MSITTEELARIRAIAEADRDGADGKAWDETITPDTVIALCRELEIARKHAVTMSEVASAAWGGEIPSPLPGHTHKTEEVISRSYDCPWCGGSGHVDDCDEVGKQVKAQLERMYREVDWLAGIVVHRAYCPFPLNCRYPDDPVTLEPTGTCKECILEAAHEAAEEGMLRKGD